MLEKSVLLDADINALFGECVPPFGAGDPFARMLLDIIRTPEFARMRDIPQLGFVKAIFPEADHTRFDHSIGAFKTMRKIIYYSRLNSGMSESDAARFTLEELSAQAAMLLHDIGHAFPGHPFERAMKKFFPDTYRSHEVIGREIITGNHCKIPKILDAYHPGFSEMVMKILAEDDLFNNIWQNIHAGTINADTLDYFGRDLSRVNGERADTIGLVDTLIKHIWIDGNRIILKGWSTPSLFYILLIYRGRLYTDVYFNGKPAAAEAFILPFMQRIKSAIDAPKTRDKITSAFDAAAPNPFINYIISSGTSYTDYLGLTEPAFMAMAARLQNCGVSGIGKLAAAYADIPNKFQALKIYKNFKDKEVPDPEVLTMVEKATLARHGIYSNMPVSLYNLNNPEVYFEKDGKIIPFSETSEYLSEQVQDILHGQKMRVIQSFFQCNVQTSVRYAKAIGPILGKREMTPQERLFLKKLNEFLKQTGL